MIWQEDRKRWLTVGAEVSDLIGAQRADSFFVRPIGEDEIRAEATA